MNEDTENHLDLERLKSLGELSDGNVYPIVDRFANSLLQRIHDLRDVVERHDSAGTKSLVHQLKGSALNCGFIMLAGLLSRPRENDQLDTDSLVRCASESIEIWKLFLSREIVEYPEVSHNLSDT